MDSHKGMIMNKFRVPTLPSIF